MVFLRNKVLQRNLQFLRDSCVVSLFVLCCYRTFPITIVTENAACFFCLDGFFAIIAFIGVHATIFWYFHCLLIFAIRTCNSAFKLLCHFLVVQLLQAFFLVKMNKEMRMSVAPRITKTLLTLPKDIPIRPSMPAIGASIQDKQTAVEADAKPRELIPAPTTPVIQVVMLFII